MTHLHFDHSGGTTHGTKEDARPVFARAQHVIQKREWYDATHPHERNRASYLPENLRPIEAAGLLRLVEGDTEIVPGVRVIPTPGHTAGHQSVVISDGNGHHVVFFGDVIPTALHLRLPFIMGYDLDVVGTLEAKRSLLKRVEQERWLAVFGHERERPAGYLGRDPKGNLVVTEPVPLA
jgi:glyoxylase-like metal-dependent hydrolase (beta-lactamase superfamily II)